MIENTKLRDILNVVFALENKKGHLKWSVSELGRSTGVSRSLVYYHLGKNKKEILEHCIEVVAAEFYGLNPIREEMVRRGDLEGSLMYTRKMFTETPEFSLFYIRWRMTNTEVGAKLKDIDDRYQKKIRSLFPHLNKVEGMALQAILQGIVTAPELSEDSLKTALQWLNPYLKN